MKIEVKNLSKTFGKTKIFANINLTMENGKIYGLIGRNGSGKSVFLKILSGLYEPTTGEILIDGINYIKDLDFLPQARVLIEKPEFIPDLTGLENLQLLADIEKKITEEQIIATLKDVNLFEDKDKKFKQYSLGMKQKLGIAQVLMENPEIIILDEPFNGIEAKTTDKLRKILLDKKKNGKLIVIASHIEQDIELLADDVYQFTDGEIVKNEG